MATKRKNYSIESNPAYITGKRMMSERASTKKLADTKAESFTKSQSLNPAGMAKFKGYVTDLGYPDVKSLPSSSHSARLRGNKARGTDSSAKRVPVK